jgi:hypothetical protein
MAWNVLHKEAVAAARIRVNNRLDDLLGEIPKEMVEARCRAQEMRTELRGIQTLADVFNTLRKANALGHEVVRIVRTHAIKKLKGAVDSLPLDMDEVRGAVYAMLGDIDLQDSVEDVNRLAKEADEYILESLNAHVLIEGDKKSDGGAAVPVRK